MAKLRRPLNSEKARGNIGGIIFSESNQVNYARRKTVKPYQKTQARKEAASRLALASYGWQRMTEAEKDEWRKFADTTQVEGTFGEETTKPAFAWYCACRENLNSVKHPKTPRITGALFPPAPTYINIQAPDFFSPTLQIFTGIETEPTRFYPRLYISDKKSPSRLFNLSECHLVKGDTVTHTSVKINMTEEQYQQFKGVYTVYAQLVDRDSGLAGPMFKKRVEFT